MARPPKPLEPDESYAQFYGARIRADRTKAGMTVEDLARKLYCDASQVSRFEHGERVPSMKTAKILDALFGETYYSDHRNVAAKSRIPPRVRELAEYQANAQTARMFSHGAVVGLLQSPSYVKALADDSLRPQLADEVVEERLRSQGVLDGPNPLKLQAIMSEVSIEQLTHHPTIAREQVKLLLERSEQWNVQIQLVPKSNISYVGSQCSFTIYESRKNGSLIVWLNVLGKASQIVDADEAVADLLEGYDLIRSAAWPVAESREKLKKIQESL